MEGEETNSFGKLLREKRSAKFTLRRFAEEVGISPTYLSQVEQGNAAPPTADRIKRMAALLGENPDAWIALAGRVPEDLPPIIHQQPIGMPQLLREASGLTADQLRKLTEEARKLKEEKGSQ